MSDIINLTLSALIDKIKNKELSSQEITNAYIARAEKSKDLNTYITTCLLYTSPSPRDRTRSRMPSSA